MNIRINGKAEVIENKKTIAELISARGLVAEHLVVEHNERITPPEEWHKAALSENDNIEIVSFVGGG